MTLFQSWKDSLTLLKPKNAQLFFLVTVKSIIEAYKLILVYWSWVIVIMILCYVVPIVFPAIEHGYMAGESWNASLWLYQLLLFATCLATRPSVMQKNCLYFRSHIYYFLYTMILLIFIPRIFWPTALLPQYIFFTLFFLDSEKNPRDLLFALWNSLKMVIYNFPLLLAVAICFNLPVWFYHSLPIWLVPAALNVFAALLLPIGVCTYANIYIKKLHEQFDLYFQSP